MTNLCEMSRALGVPRNTLQFWLDNPARFDPYYDHIAVVRALAGDMDVYDNLTHFERRLVVALLERAFAVGEPLRDRFPFDRWEGIHKAIKTRRDRLLDPPKPKQHRIAELRLTPEMCAKAKAMRRDGIDFAIIGRQLGLSRSSVFRAIRAAA
jgi:hypothetical protein